MHTPTPAAPPRRPTPLLLLLLLALPATTASAAEEGKVLVTSGGYMQTTTADGQGVPLPLKGTAVAADVAGFLASVKVTQTFTNPYDRPIEAVYVFPLPERAAVHALTMRVGSRVIRGTIQKRAEARRIYEEAKAAGKTAALLDQERPNLFTQSVANILPREEIVVELSYVEDLKYQHGEYEFVFPMVVGPRFIGGETTLGFQGTGWSPDTTRVPDASRITPPLLLPGTRSGHDIQLRLQLDAGMAIEALASPTHEVVLDRAGPEEATVTLAPQDRIPNKDFVLRYRVAGARPKLALLTERDQEAGYFLLMLQPQVDDQAYRVAPREYVFVVDTSGSMHGFPLEQAKSLIARCLKQVGPQDTFQVIGFAGSASFLFPAPVAPTPDHVRLALERVGSWRGGGGTQFLPALDKALNAPRDPGRSRVVLFLSDGYIGYEAEVLRYLRSNLKGANLFALGVGSSVNRFLIGGMARIGQGEPFYLLPREAPEPVVQRFFEYVSRPSLTDLQVDWGGLDVLDTSPAYLADLFAERPLFVVGRYEQGGTGKVRITGRHAGQPYQETIEVTLPPVPHGRGSGISYLWARRSIQELMDLHRMEPTRRQEIEKWVTDLALRFHLMSDFTSFVAVDEVVRSDGTATTVPVPVPLPEGVSPLAAPPGAYVGGPIATRTAPPAPPTGGLLKHKLAKPMLATPDLDRASSGSRGQAPTGLGKGDAAAAGGGGYGLGGLGVRGGIAPARLAPASAREQPPEAAAAPRKPQPTVRLVPGKVFGPTDQPPPAATLPRLELLVQELLPAYTRVLATDGWARGEVGLRLEVGPDGKVLRATVTVVPFGGEGFKRELGELARRWSLPGLPAGIWRVTLAFGG